MAPPGTHAVPLSMQPSPGELADLLDEPAFHVGELEPLGRK